MNLIEFIFLMYLCVIGSVPLIALYLLILLVYHL